MIVTQLDTIRHEAENPSGNMNRTLRIAVWEDETMKAFKTNCRMKTFLILSASTATIVIAPMASAQTAEDENTDFEIVVTAQKREQNLQDVPIPIQVVSDEFINDLAADNISDISRFIPGLEVSAGSPTQPSYKIRGVQTSDFGVGTDPAVGVYVDGIYSARSGAAVLSFGDIERIEVLKGPQGTLFGRNSAAGAVSIITKKPVDRFEGKLQARLGNYAKKRIEGLLNVPIGDNLALRVNGLYNKRNGLFRDAATGERLNRENNWAARAALRWEISSDTDATLTWTHDNLDQDARPAIGIVSIPPAPGQPPVPSVPADYLNPFKVPIFNDVIDNHETRNLDETSLTINHDFGDIAFSSISSWRKFRTENREDEDGTNRVDLYFDTNNRERNESWYQELRLAGETGAFNWIVGTSYFNEKAQQVSDTFTFTDTVNTTLGNVGLGTPFTDLENGLLIPLGVPATLLGHGWREAMFNEGKFKAFAAYADVIWAVSDRLKLTVGGRYTKDKKRFQWLNGPREAPTLDATLQSLAAQGILGLAGVTPADFQFDLVFDQSPLAGIGCDNGGTVTEGAPCVLKRSYSNFSPRVVVDYKVADDILLYASFTKGYKAGGFNSVQIASEFKNEDVTNFEFGVKSQFREAHLILNLSGFRYVYKNKQSIRLGLPAGSSIPQYLVETSDDQAWGADFELNWNPVKPLRLFANTQYIDSTFKKRVLANNLDLSGQPTGEPKLSTAFGARYEHIFEGGSRLAFQAAHSYRGRTRQNDDSIAQGALSATTAFKTGSIQNRTDLRLSWTSKDERFEFGLYGNNVFNNRYVSVNNLTKDTLGTPFVSISEPVFWGGDVTVKF
ncbi:TonB-dependent receptor [Sphingorhabdus sp. IMCC26285]|uniref:TonB-dependent receptor n=1 Tax=Sphingorhabdus profundilacus TaxID=2509718 RepID=A0A6I4LY18_9SPHN|nr:TonB-dependent receptor [Sphingorhabdus profundilacus]